ncbi:hypothetical protein V1L52_06885 [Treponema sp. HNW]|uniref:hypothetical protein n=1 Tax=Treponema sp. HNW TaxID=3116654 RepID=UPI003D0A7D78
MKALLISESQDILDSYALFFNGIGYDNLCYRWLLKAMDNLEEIKPDLVFIDASDYPRHWKTLVQHIRACQPSSPVILLASEHLNEEDRNKAQFLGVYCITASIEEEDTRKKLREYLNPQAFPLENAPESAQKPESLRESETEAEPESELLSEAELEIEEWEEPPEETPVLGEETISVEIEEVEAEPEAAADEAMNTKKAETEPEAEAAAEPVREAEIESKPVSEIASEDIPVEEAEVSLNQNELQSLTESVPAAEPESIFIDESEPQAPSTETESFTFIHPSTKTPIYGSLIEYNPPLLFFRPDDENLFRSLRFGQKSEGIIKRTEKSDHVFVQIQGLDEGVAEVCILK